MELIVLDVIKLKKTVTRNEDTRCKGSMNNKCDTWRTLIVEEWYC